MKIYFLSILLLFACCAISIAHGDKKHKKDSTSVQADSAKQEHLQGDTVHHHEEVMKVDQSKVTAELSDFPSLHPLIVHFAIVLIIIAAALQLLNLIILKKEIAWIIAGMLLTGFLAAWFASKNFHPHTHGISDHAKLVLEQHDKFADWTIYTVIVGLVLQILYLIFMRYRKMMEAIPVQGSHGFSSKFDRGFTVIVAIVLLSSAYCVSRAGHYGAQLVHIEGIGPQGKFLEMENEH
ncbi:MAG: hypothetical protein C0490_14290 [Marivirga sp.]|nr:hypothetical protein [Marivirga sp.]